MSRILDFFDGFSSATQPLIDFIAAGRLQTYPDDAAYVTAKGEPAAEGDLYWNTTDKIIRIFDGTDWQSISGDVNFIREDPSGLIDGVNTDYTLSFVPITDQHILVYVDGLSLSDADFTVSGLTISLTLPLQVNQTITAWYITDGTASPISLPAGTENVQYFTLSNAQEVAKEVQLAATPAVGSKVRLDLLGGTAQEFGVDFNVVGDKVTWTGLTLDGILLEGDRLRVVYLS